MTPSEMKAAAEALESRVLAEATDLFAAHGMAHLLNDYTASVAEMTLAAYTGKTLQEVAAISAQCQYRRAKLFATLVQFDPTNLPTTH